MLFQQPTSSSAAAFDWGSDAEQEMLLDERVMRDMALGELRAASGKGRHDLNSSVADLT
ncbi:hypothetical protein ACVDG8_002550 [Mesorhizobium sp. ORM8.1]